MKAWAWQIVDTEDSYHYVHEIKEEVERKAEIAMACNGGKIIEVEITSITNKD